MNMYRGTDELIVGTESFGREACLLRRQIENEFITAGKKVVTVVCSGEFLSTVCKVCFVFHGGRVKFLVQNAAEMVEIIKFLAPKHVFLNCTDTEKFSYVSNLRNAA